MFVSSFFGCFGCVLCVAPARRCCRPHATRRVSVAVVVPTTFEHCEVVIELHSWRASASAYYVLIANRHITCARAPNFPPPPPHRRPCCCARCERRARQTEPPPPPPASPQPYYHRHCETCAHHHHHNRSLALCVFVRVLILRCCWWFMGFGRTGGGGGWWRKVLWAVGQTKMCLINSNGATSFVGLADGGTVDVGACRMFCMVHTHIFRCAIVMCLQHNVLVWYVIYYTCTMDVSKSARDVFVHAPFGNFDSSSMSAIICNGLMPIMSRMSWLSTNGM